MARKTANGDGRRNGLQKCEFICPQCEWVEVRYFPTRRTASANPLYCQWCPGNPTGTGEMMILYVLEGVGSDPDNELRDAPPGYYDKWRKAKLRGT